MRHSQFKPTAERVAAQAPKIQAMMHEAIGEEDIQHVTLVAPQYRGEGGKRGLFIATNMGPEELMSLLAAALKMLMARDVSVMHYDKDGNARELAPDVDDD